MSAITEKTLRDLAADNPGATRGIWPSDKHRSPLSELRLMSPLVTMIQEEATAEEIFRMNAARESALSRLLMLYISTGLFFMLLLGTFLGVWNLLAISSHRAADSISAALTACLRSMLAAAFVLLAGMAMAIYALSLFEMPVRPAKVKGLSGLSRFRVVVASRISR